MSEVKRFFFEKKKQKTFPLGAQSVGPGANGKSFLLLFFKKEALVFIDFFVLYQRS